MRDQFGLIVAEAPGNSITGMLLVTIDVSLSACTHYYCLGCRLGVPCDGGN